MDTAAAHRRVSPDTPKARAGLRTPTGQWLLFGLTVALLGAALASYLYTLRVGIRTHEGESLTQLAHVVEENLAIQLSVTNQALEAVRAELPALATQKEPQDLFSQRLAAMARLMPGVRAINVYDAQGTIVHSNERLLIGQNFRERDYFQTALRAQDPQQLMISPPLLTRLGVYTTVLSKPLHDHNGQFVGIVAASLEPAYFETLLKSVLYAPDMRAGLIHADGKLVYRVPDPQNVTGADISSKPSALFIEHQKSGLPGNLLMGRIALTGEHRLSMFQTIRPRPPLTVDKLPVLVLSREVPAMFAQWQSDAYWRAGAFSVLALAAGIALYLVQRRQATLVRSERARLASEQQLQAFYELDLVGLTITSPEKGWVRVNQTLCRMLGYSEDELRGMTWAQLTHPQDLSADERQFARLLAGEIDGYQLEKRFISHSGAVVPTNLVVRCVRQPDGAVAYVLAMVEDITERKQLEESLRFRQFGLDHTVEMLYWIDSESHIRDANVTACKVAGYTHAQMLQLRVSDIDPQFPLQRWAQHWQELRAAKTLRFESQQMTHDGRVFPTEVIANYYQYEGTEYNFALVRDITQRKLAEAQVHQLAFNDALTGLPNRRLLLDRLSQSMAANARNACYGALMFLDIDGFKPVNDQHGHDVGDGLLVEAAARLRGCVREMDTVARFGGDEFIVVISELTTERTESLAQAGLIAEKVRLALSEPYRLNLQPMAQGASQAEHRCTASIGVALFWGHDCSPAEILKQADAAMYQAKQAGRNSIRFGLQTPETLRKLL